MSVDQQWRPQTTLGGSKPTVGDGALDQGLILKTLNLHATAINTGLSRLHALETELKQQPAPSSQSVTFNPSTAPDWLQAALGAQKLQTESR